MKFGGHIKGYLWRKGQQSSHLQWRGNEA